MKIFFTVISLVFSLAVFASYYVQIWRRKAKPHIFSWLTWGILLGLGFVLSFLEGGGKGSWVFALQSLLCLTVVAWVLLRKEIQIAKSDWIALTGAVFAMAFYVTTKNALLSAILASVIEIAGFFPTFHKSYSKPYDEPALTYFFSSLSFAFSIAAIEKYALVTLLYPAVLVVTNLIFIIFLHFRRTQVDAIPKTGIS